MNRAAFRLPGLEAPVLPGLSEPRTEMFVRQGAACGDCAGPLSPSANFARHPLTRDLLWLVCRSCQVESRRDYDLAEIVELEQKHLSLGLPSLLALRLRVGRHLSFPRFVTGRDAEALATRDWDHFVTPTHALWVHQAGQCALAAPGEAHGDVVLDHDHHGRQLARGLLCESCNIAEGKNSKRFGPRLDQYRWRSPARACLPTRGLSYAYLTLGST